MTDLEEEVRAFKRYQKVQAALENMDWVERRTSYSGKFMEWQVVVSYEENNEEWVVSLDDKNIISGRNDWTGVFKTEEDAIMGLMEMTNLKKVPHYFMPTSEYLLREESRKSYLYSLGKTS